MNRLMLSGSLGSDPELRYTPNGSEVATFSLATSHKYTTSAGEKREETTWFRVSAFGKIADSCNEYLEKGSYVVVLGRLKASPWVGKDGQAQAGLECVADSVEFGPRREGKINPISDPTAPDPVEQSPLMDVPGADSMAAH